MGRLQEFMSRMENGDDDDDRLSDLAAQEELLNRQKQTDLMRAQARSVARPIKKEKRHSQIDGRYIRPEEVKKEIEKLEKAKQAAEQKKLGLFGRIFRKKNKKTSVEETVRSVSPDVEKKENANNPRTEVSDAERKRKAEQIRRLRGIALAKKTKLMTEEAEARYLSVNGLNVPQDDFTASDEYGFIPQETDVPEESERPSSFMAAVERLNAQGAYEEDNGGAPRIWGGEFSSDFESEAQETQNLFAPVFSGEPDRVIATALSAAVGFIYWDEDGNRVDRIITIRRLFYRQGDILIDAFCHDIALPRLIAFSRGIKMYNLQTMKAYENPRDFLLYHISGETNERFGVSGFTAALSVVRYELTALVFVAKSDFNRDEEENKLMLSYVSQRCPTIDFDEREMLDYLAMLVPDEQSFSEALGIVIKQPQEIVFLFVRTFLQMMLSDGILHENEREFLAELLYLLQTEGIELSRIGLE